MNIYEWALPSPLNVELEHGNYRLKLEVTHNLQWDVTPTADDLPRVVRVDLLESVGGEPLGAIKLDLDHIANMAIARAINEGFFFVRIVGSQIWGPPGPDNWREVAQAIRATFIHTGPRFTWTEDLDALLMSTVRHVADHGTATMEDIAAEFGTTPGRLRTRLTKLRKTHAIPYLKTGRPKSNGST